MSNATLDPVIVAQTKNEKVGRSQVIGLMDDTPETEAALGQSPYYEKKVTSLPSSGQLIFNQVAEATWNSVGGLSKDTSDAFLDLGKNFLGLGEFNPYPSGTNPEPTVAQIPDEDTLKITEAKEIRFVLNRIQELNQAQSEAEFGDLMKDSLRMTGGIVTEEKVRSAGHNKGQTRRELFSIATLKDMGGTNTAEAQQVEEQMEEAEDASIQPLMGEKELDKGLERSGGGHWSNTAG